MEDTSIGPNQGLVSKELTLIEKSYVFEIINAGNEMETTLIPIIPRVKKKAA
tara:strand:+ start:728 stop:883 length:156 start_codon:yes stop_codon:yes gene_type:complete